MTDNHFVDVQYQFAAHLRNPAKNPAPANIEDRRLAIYRDLFYNNIEGFIASGFPVLRTLYTDVAWQQLVRNFMHIHQSTSPYFLEISEEFLAYLQNEHQPQVADPPFLLELAHYEWVELALSVAEVTPDLTGVDPNGDFLSGQPILSPLAWLLQYQWPVHRISKEYRPTTPPEQPSFIIVYRDRLDKVHFMEVNPVTARLIALIQQQPDSNGATLLQQIAAEMQHPDPDVILQHGQQAFEQLKAKGILLGCAINLPGI